MPDAKREILSGWGRCPIAECTSFRPEKRREMKRIIHQSGSIIARGLGRSYGDASLQPVGVLRTERLNHFIEFDAAKGLLRAQGGVTLAEAMDLCVPRGWLPAVIPGTRHVTLGGAVACNIHGKNHWREGDFAEYVLALRVMLASGESVECSPMENRDLFWATAGGMGMTGIIEEVALKLKPIASASLRTTAYQVDSLEDMIAAFEHYRASSDYMVGWIDHTAAGAHIGRGIFEAARHISVEEGGAPVSSFAPLKTKFSVPPFMPGWLLNRHTMALYNKRRFGKYTMERQNEITGFNHFFHPLDAIGHWNRLYGRRGFFQYQCLLPETQDIAAQIQALLAAIARKKIWSFLAVIKYHGDGKGFLTFSKRGYSVALDFPNTRRVRSVLPQIDRWVAERGGRVYLAKDALLTAELFDKMYPAAPRWREALHEIDINAKFTSLMSERLQWKPSSS